jgi:hypothetical protein
MPNNPRSTTGGIVDNEAQQFEITSQTENVGFDFEDVQPPGFAYVDVADRLFITTVSNGTTNPPQINVRMLRPDGEVQVIPISAPLNAAARTPQTTIVPLIEGYILSVSVSASATQTTTTLTFVSVALVRNPATPIAQTFVLCSGYVNNVIGFGYPQSSPQRMTDGNGSIHAIGVTNPAPGADWVFTVPTGARMRIISVCGFLTTSVAVANRVVSLLVWDGVNVPFQTTPGFNQAASITDTYTWADSISQAALFAGISNNPLAGNLILSAGLKVQTQTAALQAADQWGGVSLLVQEWLDAL